LFVPILEQDSLFPELGKWILREAMMSGNRIRAKYPDFVMNVNLSYAQLERVDFIDVVTDLLKVTRFPAKNLCLEITERCRLLDVNLLKRIFEKLRELGVRIALDDFGTGFSSLGVLRKLPIDCVKIDRDYVLNIQSSEDDQNTVKFIAQLAESFGAELCVEGVETQEMRDMLRRFNVTTFQGFFYSRPIPLEEFCEKYNC
jgi:EAL domain-containing protein (putative c-di-GMP-specific phosphodiesterase class I)